MTSVQVFSSVQELSAELKLKNSQSSLSWQRRRHSRSDFANVNAENVPWQWPGSKQALWHPRCPEMVLSFCSKCPQMRGRWRNQYSRWTTCNQANDSRRMTNNHLQSESEGLELSLVPLKIQQLLWSHQSFGLSLVLAILALSLNKALEITTYWVV